jgi:hypothetical protein
MIPVYTHLMLRTLMSDPKVRRAYLTTKLGMIAAVGVGTVPLASFLGPKVWYGYGVFVAVMVLIAVALLSIGKPDIEPVADEEPEAEEEDGESELDGELEVVLPIEDSIDLHPFAPAEIPDVVSDYLEAAHAAGHREVRLIHGRGIGVQRERVQSLLSRHPMVSQYHDAPPSRGGWGATVAYLNETLPSDYHHVPASPD